jgi:hypothetical protein
MKEPFMDWAARTYGLKAAGPKDIAVLLQDSHITYDVLANIFLLVLERMNFQDEVINILADRLSILGGN